MIWVTGDVHNTVDFDKIYRFIDKRKREKTPVTENDIIIIAGDFGIPWVNEQYLIDNGIDFKEYPSFEKTKRTDEMLIKYLESQKCTFLFVDGNHDLIPVLNALPEFEMFGAPVGQLGINIFHLKRGYVYTINDKKVFTFGGAESIDKHYRTEHISWWKEEVPSMEEYDRAVENFLKVDNEVDFIITHTLPNSIIPLCGIKYLEDKRRDPTTMMLDNFYRDVKFKRWFCGHFHNDMNYYKFRLLYYDFVPMVEKETNYV